LKKLLKITLFRMWAAGSVCFFGAWGRTGPQGADMENAAGAFSLNLILGLVAIMILCDIIIVNPVIRMAGGKRIFGEEKKGLMFVFSLPLHFIKVTAIMALVVGTYYFLNVLAIRIFSLEENQVPVPLEPILFGILYGLYYLLFDIIYNLILKRVNTENYSSENRELS